MRYSTVFYFGLCFGFFFYFFLFFLFFGFYYLLYFFHAKSRKSGVYFTLRHISVWTCHVSSAHRLVAPVLDNAGLERKFKWLNLGNKPFSVNRNKKKMNLKTCVDRFYPQTLLPALVSAGPCSASVSCKQGPLTGIHWLSLSPWPLCSQLCSLLFQTNEHTKKGPALCRAV